MMRNLPPFRLRTLFGVSTIIVLTCALAAMMETAPPTQVGWRVTALGVFLGAAVGYRRTGPPTMRAFVAGLFMLGGCLIAAFLTLVACVWQDWNRINGSADMASLGAGGFMICFLAPGAAVVAVLMLRAWTW